MAKKRVYKKGVAGSEHEYQGSEEQKNNRAARNKARREAIRDGKVEKGTPNNRSQKEVDHIKPLSKGGSTDKSNTRIVSRTTNRKKADK